MSVRKEAGHFQYDSVTPAKAGVQAAPEMVPRPWIPASAGMTYISLNEHQNFPDRHQQRVDKVDHCSQSHNMLGKVGTVLYRMLWSRDGSDVLSTRC